MKLITTHIKKHRLNDVPLFIRGLYILPSFILTFASQSLLFNLFIFFLYIAANYWVTNISLLKVMKLYMIPAMFILSGCLSIMLSFKSTAPLFTIRNFAIGFDRSGIDLAASVLARSLAIISIVYFWMLTHSISEISKILCKCKIPSLFIELFVLTYKFIFNIKEASSQMLIAQRCRLAYTNKGNNIKTFSMLVYAVFRKAINQSNQLEMALSARLGDGMYHFTNPHIQYRRSQLLAPILLSFLVFVLFLISKIYG